jgi:hypothetical protein
MENLFITEDAFQLEDEDVHPLPHKKANIQSGTVMYSQVQSAPVPPGEGPSGPSVVKVQF